MRVRPGDPPAATLALLAGVALHEIVAAHAGESAVRIKWPNDLMAGESKLAGILLERTDDAVVIGFGVNLGEHPDDLDRPVTSLRARAGSAPSPSDFLEQLAAAFAAWLSRWRSEGLGPIRASWLAKAHPLGTALSTTLPDGVRIDGLFDGLDETGAMKMRLADGSSRTIHAGDVFFL